MHFNHLPNQIPRSPTSPEVTVSCPAASASGKSFATERCIQKVLGGHLSCGNANENPNPSFPSRHSSSSDSGSSSRRVPCTATYRTGACAYLTPKIPTPSIVEPSVSVLRSFAILAEQPCVSAAIFSRMLNSLPPIPKQSCRPASTDQPRFATGGCHEEHSSAIPSVIYSCDNCADPITLHPYTTCGTCKICNRAKPAYCDTGSCTLACASRPSSCFTDCWTGIHLHTHQTSGPRGCGGKAGEGLGPQPRRF